MIPTFNNRYSNKKYPLWIHNMNKQILKVILSTYCFKRKDLNDFKPHHSNFQLEINTIWIHEIRSDINIYFYKGIYIIYKDMYLHISGQIICPKSSLPNIQCLHGYNIIYYRKYVIFWLVLVYQFIGPSKLSDLVAFF